MARNGRSSACFILLLILSFAMGSRPVRADVPVFYDIPPAVAVFPDDLPLTVGFHFAGGGAAERFTGNRDAWYSIYRFGMLRGVSYNLVMSHNGDGDRLRVYALDNHPFGQVGMKYELKLSGKGGMTFRQGEKRTFVAAMTLPDYVPATEIFLLLEWMPRFDKNRPLPVSLQILTTYLYQRPGNRQLYSWERGMAPEFADLTARPVTLPLKRPEFPGLKEWRQQ